MSIKRFQNGKYCFYREGRLMCMDLDLLSDKEWFGFVMDTFKREVEAIDTIEDEGIREWYYEEVEEKVAEILDFLENKVNINNVTLLRFDYWDYLSGRISISKLINNLNSKYGYNIK